MIHYVIVEPFNGKLEAFEGPPIYEVGELVPEAMHELKGSAPVLYCMEHPDDQLQAIRQQAERDLQAGRVPFVCAIIESDKASTRLQLHLANGLLLPKPGGGAAVFRFYDPRVFAHLRWLLRGEQLSALLGPVTRWTYLDQDAGWLSVEGAENPDQRFSVAKDQYAQIARIELVERVLSVLRTRPSPLKADAPRLVESYLSRGEAYGLEGHDLIAFAVHGATTSPYFDRHPRVQAVLRAQRERPYLAEVRSWEAKDWEAIARESMQYQ